MDKKLRLNEWVFEIAATPNSKVTIGELLEKQSVKASLQYIGENQDTIQQQLMDAIRADYDEVFKLYGKDENIPVAENNDELKTLLAPLSVIIHDTVKDDFNYVGFGFDCSWQKEHGIGVLMYKDSVVQHGGEDHAFLEYLAEDDASAK